LKDKEVQINFRMGSLPSVYILEATMPDKIIDDVNDYMDEYKENKNKKFHSDKLVGQTHKGEQLLLEHNDPRMIDYCNLITMLSSEYIKQYIEKGNQIDSLKKVEIKETWSVHSYEGDYNPLHDHDTDSIMGISTTAWTKVPPQIGAKAHANTDSYSLYNESGHSDGCITFQYGKTSASDNKRLVPSQSFVVTPEVGKLLIFPSWLQHMVYPFKGEGERRTIASNLNCWDVQTTKTEALEA
tara:strand:+ start:576 stop:1298 length:723 start_codon:yes stop_codon:yes gene_type:complete